ncbi:MAG: hypothetical protein ACK5QT_06540, partial [Oligoflexia bacterium]
MRVLISFSDQIAMDFVALALQGYHKAEVNLCPTLDSLMEALNSTPDKRPAPSSSNETESGPLFDLIFCEHPTRSTIIGTLLRKNKLEIPLVLFDGGKGSKTPPPEGVKVLGQVSWSTWAENLGQILSHSKFPHDEAAELKIPDEQFSPIRTRLLLEASPLPAEVFIRLSENNYLKIFHAGDLFLEADYEKYAIKKGVGAFYLDRDSIGKFISKLAEAIQRRINAGMTPQDATSISEEILRTTQLLLQQGLTPPEVSELIKTNLNLTLQAIGNKPSLKTIFDASIKHDPHYLISHSVTLCQVSCTIASLMDWASKLTFSKLNFAALLHDLTLEQDDLAHIKDKKTLEDLRAHDGQTVADLVLNHGDMAAELSQKFIEIPPDVDHILMEH